MLHKIKLPNFIILLPLTVHVSAMYPTEYSWRSWLVHCATIRKAAGSIPNGVIGIFL